MKKWEKPMIQELHLSYTNDEIGLYGLKPNLYCPEDGCCKVYKSKAGNQYEDTDGAAAYGNGIHLYCNEHPTKKLQIEKPTYCS